MQKQAAVSLNPDPETQVGPTNKIVLQVTQPSPVGGTKMPASVVAQAPLQNSASATQFHLGLSGQGCVHRSVCCEVKQWSCEPAQKTFKVWVPLLMLSSNLLFV